MEKGVKNLQHLARLAEKRQKDNVPSQINTTLGSEPMPPSTGIIPSSSYFPSSSSICPPRNSLGSIPDDSGIELSTNDLDTSDEFSPGTTRSVRGASGSSIPSSFSSSRRASTIFPHPSLPPSLQQQTPGPSPELVQRSKASSMGSMPAVWSSLPPHNSHMQPSPPQHDPMALHRGSLPSIHSIISPRPGAPAFSHP